MTAITTAEVEYVMEQAWKKCGQTVQEVWISGNGIDFFRAISEELRIREEMASPAGLKRLFPGIH